MASSLADFQRPKPVSMAYRAMEQATRVLLPAPPLEMETDDPKKLPRIDPLSEYAERPLAFMVEKLGIAEYTLRWALNEGYDVHTWDGTKEPLLEILDGLVAWEDVAVESATGTGKSFLGACIILWFIACFPDARVFTFAPKEEQLRAYIWMEIGRLWDRFQVLFPTAVLTDLRIRMRGQRDMAWGAMGYAVGTGANEEVSTKAQGMHAAHMLLIYEETPGIKTAVTEAGENTCTAPHNLRLAFGNPDNQLDALHLFGHDALGKPRPGVRNVRISAYDHPNLVTRNADLIPGAASWKSVNARRNKYGEDHPLYKSRVCGMSPAEAKDALIKLEWVRRAQRRWLDENDKRILTNNGKAKRALGVDVANSEDGDEAAIAEGIGAYLETIESFPCPNANNLGYDVHLRMKEKHIEDEHVGVDVVGVGAGAVNELKRKERYVKALGGGAAPQGRVSEGTGNAEVAEEEEYNNLRSQMMWVLREDLREDRIALPIDEAMARELTIARWHTRDSKIIIESKKDIKKRTPGGKSPNKADAVTYWNWVRDRTPLVSTVPKRNPTTAERIKKELEDMDRRDHEHYQEPMQREKYGSVLRQ